MKCCLFLICIRYHKDNKITNSKERKVLSKNFATQTLIKIYKLIRDFRAKFLLPILPFYTQNVSWHIKEAGRNGENKI